MKPGLEFFSAATNSVIKFTNNTRSSTTGSTTMTLDTTKKYVGIGTASPSTTLHIFATQSGAFRLEDGTQGNGYILTSDANGVATWTASTYAFDSNVVHRTGDESISGIKTFQNIGVLTSVVVQNYNTNPSSSALESLTANGGIGIKSENIASGIGIYSNSTSTGLNYVGANNGVTTFSVNKTGAVSIGTGTASDSRFLVSSSGGTNSLVVNEQGDAIFSNILKVSSSNRVEISATANTTGANLLTLNDGSGLIQRNFYIDRLATSGAGISFRFSNTTFLRIDNNMISQSSGYYIFSSETPMYHGSNLSYISKQFTTGSEYRFVATSATSSTTLAFLTVPIYTIDTDWTTPANKKFSVFVPFNIGTGTASNSRFLVSSSGGTTSFYVNEAGDSVFRGSVVIADGTQGNGYILTSDANGVASWTASFALGVIATSSNITTDTLDINGLNQRGRCIIIDNGTYSINLTVNGATGFSSTYLKHGTASVTFVQGSGRTLVQVDGTAVLNGVAGSTATLLSYGTTDYLRINNA
jgi:hypothetical protein